MKRPLKVINPIRWSKDTSTPFRRLHVTTAVHINMKASLLGPFPIEGVCGKKP